MSRLFVKIIDKLKRMDRMIRLKATGSPDELARKLSVSPSTLYEYLLILKHTFRAPVAYCRVRRSYLYREAGRISFEFRRE
ncbi:MAG: hypothetical protein DI538_06475 [Azospira oryzae]|nr:MAG: hypothetical protein DI538_06475 [Azospira oryzae]